eukprot:1160104-Pelagomonas_calceolata.AAC.18
MDNAWRAASKHLQSSNSIDRQCLVCRKHQTFAIKQLDGLKTLGMLQAYRYTAAGLRMDLLCVNPPLRLPPTQSPPS